MNFTTVWEERSCFPTALRDSGNPFGLGIGGSNAGHSDTDVPWNSNMINLGGQVYCIVGRKYLLRYYDIIIIQIDLTNIFIVKILPVFFRFF